MVLLPTRTHCALLLVAASALALTGCGGGGGGSGGNSGPPPPPPVTASFTVTPNTATVTASSVNSPVAPGPFITGAVTGTVTGTLYINIDIAGSAVKSVGALTISAGSNSGTASII